MGRLLLVSLVAIVSCSDPTGVQNATLTISVHSGESSVRWPRGSGTRTKLVNGLDDPRGFAGFELKIVDKIFTAGDFATEALSFTVPGTGRMTFTMRLVQDGQVVAEGSEGWKLSPEAEWQLDVNRAPFAPTEGYTGLDDPSCGWFYCVENWRFPILEEAANYEDEAIWVTLQRFDLCADICQD